MGGTCFPTVGLSATSDALEATVEKSRMLATMLTCVQIRVQTVSPTDNDRADDDDDDALLFFVLLVYTH